MGQEREGEGGKELRKKEGEREYGQRDKSVCETVTKTYNNNMMHLYSANIHCGQ